MVSTTEGPTDNSPLSIITYVPVKKNSKMKTLCQFYEVLDAKHKTSFYRLGATKSNIKAIIIGNMW